MHIPYLSSLATKAPGSVDEGPVHLDPTNPSLQTAKGLWALEHATKRSTHGPVAWDGQVGAFRCYVFLFPCCCCCFVAMVAVVVVVVDDDFFFVCGAVVAVVVMVVTVVAMTVELLMVVVFLLWGWVGFGLVHER